ncbi:SOS response-associated peptidase [Bradyrhizobium sp. ISRA443]|uniref:SOS response-associated peptidase n=1 Tax=unclassified Bradyrhizobium TaxID=2631580 RepID=UPI002478E9F2|nr:MULTISPECIES: SOS response-associated peptidase [unclassified Bradyrhizobium]WGS00916.1 SOS response-associated peptidase [Bradyrhizobium sp. ISRA436]WGS07803.1 SOS response-associated peptidase [Bradyrhizobium sp. ISRA437]WGS14691.1 SOS response-associated peptidase [Bradyrhizobium sp. ISRA443]
MCGRFVITSPPAALRQIFGYIEQPNFPPRYNVAPTQPIPVVILDNGGRHFQLMRWGLIPSWVKDPRSFSLLINARSETVREKPAFKNALRRRRALVPADGYYEWQDAGGRRRPFFIHRRDGRPIAFAALAETWMGPNGEEQDTVAIVTAPASRDLASLHHRVPVTIAPDAFERWLDCRANDVDDVMHMLRGPEIGEFAWHQVTTRVNGFANDDAQLMLPMTAEEIAAEEAPPPKKPALRKTPVREDDGQGSLF